MAEEKIFPRFTQREKEIIQLITVGKSTQEIADTLFISFLTVQTHRRNILQKLEVKNTAELIHMVNTYRLLY
jgi:DNA-binding NarL/FixJ family response regulator